MMLTHTDLPEEPVGLSVRGAEGHEHRVTVSRRLGGAVHARCSCAMHARERWCRHVVDVLCMRLRLLGVVDDAIELALEDLVMGTKAEDLAHELDRALIAYERALTRFDQGRSGSLAADVIETVRFDAGEIAEAAATLADAIGRFKRAIVAETVDS